MEELSYSHSAEPISPSLSLLGDPNDEDKSSSIMESLIDGNANEIVEIDDLVQEAKNVIISLPSIAHDLNSLVIAFARLKQISQKLSLLSTTTLITQNSSSFAKIEIERNSLLVKRQYLLNILQEFEKKAHPFKEYVNDSLPSDQISFLLQRELLQREEHCNILLQAKKDLEDSKERVSLKRKELASLKEDIDRFISGISGISSHQKQ